MNRIVIALTCIFGTIGIACDTEPTPPSAGIDGGAVNTNTMTATSTATGTGGSVSANGGSSATGVGGALGTGGTTASTCLTCTNTNTTITINVNITGAGGATSNGGTTTVVGTGGTVSTGGTPGTGGATTAPPKLCTPGESKACTASFGSGSQVCSNDGMSYCPCTPIATGKLCTPGESKACTASFGSGSQVCSNDGMSYGPCTPLVTGTGGAKGTGGANGTGGAVSTGGTSATGGTTSTSTVVSCADFINSTVSCGSYSFVRNWIGRPVNNGTAGAMFCFNPAFLLKDEYGISRPCPSTANLDVYNDPELGSSASLFLNGQTIPITADGACISFVGQPDGDYHVTYKYPGLANVWAYYPQAASCPVLPASSKIWLEMKPSRGSFGLVLTEVGGLTFSQNAATGGKY